MIPIMDFQERSLKGPVMKSTQFDLAFAKKVRELVGKYEIKYNPEELIVDDRTVEAGDLGTKGGLKTDANARVLNEAGEAIPGLYAIGNCSGSVTGRTYPGAGSTIGPAMTFGYIAVLDAIPT
jgi:hypothetical protein